jgi:hypothetical protein
MCIVDKLLKMFQCKERATERSISLKGFKELVESMSPKSNDDIIFCRDIVQRSGNGRIEGDLKEIVHHLGLELN